MEVVRVAMRDMSAQAEALVPIADTLRSFGRISNVDLANQEKDDDSF